MIKLHLFADGEPIDRASAVSLACHITSLLVGLECDGHDPTMKVTCSVKHAERPYVSNVFGKHSYKLDSVEGQRGEEDITRLTFTRALRPDYIPF